MMRDRVPQLCRATIFILSLFLGKKLYAGFYSYIKSLHFSEAEKKTNFIKVVNMSFSNSRILCVESYHESCELISQLLFVEKNNFDISITHSPNRALSLIGEQTFDLYIVKGRLPEMTGVELCRRIRKLDSETPILFLTGKTRVSECRIALAAGVNEFLILPVNVEKLTAKVNQLLNDRRVNFSAQSSPPVNGTSLASRL
jgi:PleD family two-component response regulator